MALTFPSSPTDGQVFTDTGTGNRYVYDASKGLWKYSSNNVGVTVGTAPPPINQVAPGAMWYNTNTGRTFIMYDDGDSKQWVENIPAPGNFDSSTVAGYANAAVIYAVAPAFNVANSALQNTTGTFAGSLTTTGNLSAGSNPFGYKISANGASAVATTWIGATNPQAVDGIGAGFIATIHGGNYAYNYQSGAGNYYITNANTNGGMYFSTNGTERVRIKSTGELYMTSGQIAFPATQVPSSDANTLDDYEEGTFTAYFAGNSTGTAMFSGSNAYGLSSAGTNGKYTKIGRRIYFNFYLNMAATFTWANGYSSSSSVWIAGLPFVESSSTGVGGIFPAVNCGYNVASGWTAAYAPMGIVESGLSSIRVGYQGTNSFLQATGSNFASGGNSMIWSGHYETTN